MAQENKSQAPLADRRSSIEKKSDIDIIEDVQTSNEQLWLQEYDLLVGKSKEELAALNKKVVKKLDWRFLTTITAMLLMKYVHRTIMFGARLTIGTAIWIGSMSPTPDLLVCRMISV